MDILSGAAIVALNILLWFSMYGIQNWEMRTKTIPGPRPHSRSTPSEGFLRIQDYHTTSWGDLLALSMIDFALGDVIFRLSWNQMAWYFGTAAAVTLYFHSFEWKGKSHKPDWAYPRKGRVSFGGLLHATYFFFQASFVIMGVHLLFFDTFVISQGKVFPLALGIILYLLAMSLDMESGRWAKTLPSVRG